MKVKNLLGLRRQNGLIWLNWYIVGLSFHLSLIWLPDFAAFSQKPNRVFSSGGLLSYNVLLFGMVLA